MNIKQYVRYICVTIIFVSIESIQAQRLWGMTSNGGSAGTDFDMAGTVFSIDTSGSDFKIEKSFLIPKDGTNPYGSLVDGNDGYFYGMCSSGGASGYPLQYGTIFKIDSNGVFIKLKDLSYTTDGGSPMGSLTLGTDGFFYGMCSSGGANNYGTIFKISSIGAFTKLKDLSSVDGINPQGSLIQGSDGFFYGMCTDGGLNGLGTIFKVSSSGVITNLRNLTTVDGIKPQGNLVEGTDGYFYGMCMEGGLNEFGTIFKISNSGVITNLRNLAAIDGVNPRGSLHQGTDGYFYGMSTGGGANGDGTIFRISSIGLFSKLKDLSFTSDGGSPEGNLIEASNGDFYGVCYEGGANGVGTVFKINSNGSFTKLKDINGITEGAFPKGSLIKDLNGNLYGTCSSGGPNDNGTIFKISSAEGFTPLRFLSYANDGTNPKGSLILGNDANFYGICSSGGAYNYGTIFKIDSNNIFTKLRDLSLLNDGGTPTGDLVQGTDGFLYGMCSFGGNSSDGTIFKISTSGIFTKLWDFADGGTPKGSLIQGNDGFFYGMCKYGGSKRQGSIFKINSDGVFIKLRDLTFADGGGPDGNLIQADDGYFYGTCFTGGEFNDGIIFKISGSGTYTKLWDFSYNAYGAYPGTLAAGSNGSFYGMCGFGGGGYGVNANAGTIFRITSKGVFNTLRSLSNTNDGGTPSGSLVQVNNGSFYGMCTKGGINNQGTLFKMSSTGIFNKLMDFNGTNTGINPVYTTLLYVELPLKTKLFQTILGFNPLPDVKLHDALPITLTSTATSGLNVSYSVSGPAILLPGNILSITGAGMINAIALQKGDGNYEPALMVVETFEAYVSITGINEGLSKDSTFLIFPNPASGSFSIQSTLPFAGDLLIYTALGKISNIISSKGKLIVEIEGLAPGIYFIQSGYERKKVVIR